MEGVCIPSPPVVLGTVLGTPAAPLSSPRRRSKDKQNAVTTQERQYTRALGLRRCSLQSCQSTLYSSKMGKYASGRAQGLSVCFSGKLGRMSDCQV